MSSDMDNAIISIDLGAASARFAQMGKIKKSEIPRLAELYRKFLFIQAENAAYYLVPTPLIDMFWTAHIADFSQYIEDTTKIFGTPFSHYSSNPSFLYDEASRPAHAKRFSDRFKERFSVDVHEEELSISTTPRISDAQVEEYRQDMKEKFSHINEPGRPLSNLHNRIKPY